MRISFETPGRSPPSLAARIVATVLGVLAFGAAMMLSALFFAGLALAGLAFWGYFRWKTRALRRTIREEMRAQENATPAGNHPPPRRAGGANVIEGEAVRVMDEERPMTMENAEERARDG
ncbi:MAG: hypothetical protein LBC91_04365 [Candidatus Accumulibacter sp.]|jgi:hypothetical protein|nr:hypothetical protein [Accumulibacter sp.]